MIFLRTLSSLCIFGAFCTSIAAEEIPKTVPRQLAFADHQLILNGYGERERWFMDVYGLALYLPKKSSSTAFIRSRETPSAIRIRVNYDPPAEAPDRWEETFRSELSRELFNRMTNVYENLEAGDVIMFTYAPDHGTKAFRNGRLLFADKGHGLMDGLLDQWLGSRPVSKNLRRLLLQ